MRKSLVVAQNLKKSYANGTSALDGVDLTVDEGEWVAIMGPSGSGKTTLLNLISCLDKPSSGSLTIDGTAVADLSQGDLTKFRRDTIGLIFQQFHLVPYLTAVENVMLAQYFHSVADELEAREALENVGLGHRHKHLPNQLSGGEQQRLCIARALINHPKIILADEPTGNLDKMNEELVMGLIRKMHAEGHTIIMVTHDPDIADMADRILHLDHGRMVQDAGVEALAVP
ncbi:MAG: ABC transporter ATP-binding protein [Chloroflexi bacterium]|nr:ABC transporter ATP-binding protein [Chloroflexota bacterium]